MYWNPELNDVVLQAISDCSDSDESQILTIVLPVEGYPQEIHNIITFIDEHSQCERIIKALGDSKHPDASQLICQVFADALKSICPKVQQFIENPVKYIAYTNPAILLPYLEDPSEAVRIAFCEIFAQVPKQEALTALLALLNDPSPRVRFHTIQALTSLKSRDAAPMLLEYLRKVTEGSSYNNFYYETTALWETQNMDVIFEALQDSRQEIRSAMSKGGWLLNHPSAIPLFLKALNDSDWWVRRKAVNQLGYLGDMTIYPDLLKLRNDPDVQVRRSLIKALVKIAEFEALPDIFPFTQDESHEVRLELVFTIFKLKHPIVLPIAEALVTDINDNVRFNAQSLMKRLSEK
jgi:HEAT repeat protein